MEANKVRWKKVLPTFVLTVLIICLAGAIYRYGFRAIEGRQSSSQADSARSRVTVNMLRTEAIGRLQADAWQHKECIYASRYDDLFFYGSHDLELAGIVLIRSDIRSGEARIGFVGSEENYRLFLYDQCRVVFVR